MRPSILSIAGDRVAPIRNAVLARAGYGVIPATTSTAGLDLLARRTISAVVIGQSLSQSECRRVCQEAEKLGVPSLVLDPGLASGRFASELHVDPLDGPEAFLAAVERIVQKIKIEKP